MSYYRSNRGSGTGVAVTYYSVFTLSDIGIITGIVLCILQACNVINIGWFWATFPLWIGAAVGLAICLLAGVAMGIFAIITHIIESRN